MHLVRLLAGSTAPDTRERSAAPPVGEPLLHRRRLLTGLAALAAAARPPAVRADQTAQQLLRLVQRVTMGLTSAEWQAALQLGYQDYLEHQLNFEAIDDSAVDAKLTAYQTLTMEPWQLLDTPSGQVVNELIEATIVRHVFSQRQLLERMVEFWTDHFNISVEDGLQRNLKTADDRDVIRPHALGFFPDMLHASAHSPAMLAYLDNTSNVKGKPNENYARELMELHSLGVDGGYTQADVEQVARCFTGWGVFGSSAGTDEGKFFFNPTKHDQNAKQVLGYDIPANGGVNDGLIVLDILSHHPSTANFIAAKMCRWMWGEAPSAQLVSAVAQTYRGSGGDIRAMLRTIFRHPEMSAAPLKYKRPYHLFISGMRAVGCEITATSSLRNELKAAGQLPFHWTTPDGYPDDLDYWVGLILARWTFGARFLNKNITGLNPLWEQFLDGANTASDVTSKIEAGLFAGAVSHVEHDALIAYLLPDPPTSQRKQESIGLAIGSPTFQWY